MFHTYAAGVSSGCCIIFTHMLQVFHLDVAYVLQSLYMCFPRVSDVCCKCFNCFGRILQMFPLDVAKVNIVLLILQWTPSAVRPACMCVGVEGARAVSAGNRADADRNGASEGHTAAGGPHEAGVRRGRPDANTVQTSRSLAFPK
jgi:hypothetical protein